MKTTVATIHSEDNSYLISAQNIVTDIGNCFLELTGYSKDEIIDKDISEVFTRLLRLHQETFEQIDINNNIECYIFTKCLEVREVTISFLQDQDVNNKIYSIIEKPNSRLDEKLIFEEQLFRDNNVGCSIYSVPDLILLKANQKYLDFMNPPYNIMEKCIGTTLKESVPKFEGSNSDELFSTIIKTGKPNYYNEYKYDHYERGITYWDGSVIPIYLEGKVKFIFQTASEITNRIINRNRIEEQAKVIEYQNVQLKHQNDLLNRQANLLNLSNEANFVWDLHGPIIYWNKGADKMYGYSSEEAIGYFSHDLLKTVHTYNFDDYELKLAKDGVWNGEIEHTCKDGRKLIVESKQQVILDEFGQQIVLETNRDITERKKTEVELNQQKEQLETIIENMYEGLFITDNDGKVIMMNAEAKNQFYKPLEKIEPGDCYNNTKYLDINGNEVSVYDLPTTRALRGEIVRNFILLARRPDKELIFEINATPIYDKNGKIVITITCSHDITEHVGLEMAFKNKANELEAIIENMSDSLFIIDSEGVYKKINKAGRELFHSIEIKNFGDVYTVSKFYDFAGNEITKEELPYSIVKQGTKVFNQQLMHKYGKETNYISFSGTPLFDESGKFISGIICARVINESVENLILIKRQQDKMLLVEKEKNDALKKVIDMKDEFLSIISHEFKTPLTVINSAIQAMELICKNELSDKAKGFLKTIRQNSNRQLKLVNNLLDITRMNAGHLKVNKKDIDIVLLSRSIIDSISIFAEQKNIRLSFSSTLNKKVIGIDEEKYERILLNLLSNAIKFTPTGKSISTRVSQKIVKGKCMVCMQVRDKGVGIPAEKQELIFERFGQVDSSLTRQAEGTGIGLHLVKLLVEMLGGEITLESKVGVGSTFTILLPIKK